MRADPARLKARGATAVNLDEVRAALHDTFLPDDWRPGAVAPFYIACDVCDPDFAPEQYRYLRLDGRVASALKVFVRRLHHPSGPLPVTIIGGVCTREELRGRGLIGPVIQDALDYSRRLGAAAMLIVTPRPNYYLRHGFVYFPTCLHSGRIPEVPRGGGRIEPLTAADAGWMTDLFNGHPARYGPIVRTEQYTARWVLERRLARLDFVGLKYVARGRPIAYIIAHVRPRTISVAESLSTPRAVHAQARLLSSFLATGRRRFDCNFPPEHPLVRHLCARGVRIRCGGVRRLMCQPLSDAFPVPGREFFYSVLDNV